MKVGVIVPQGWTGEFDGWDPAAAWARTVQVAKEAERLDFESIWLFDHFHTVPKPTDELTFESFTALAALAGYDASVTTTVCGGDNKMGPASSTWPRKRVWSSNSL